MPNEIQIEFTPEFKRNLRALAKKYRQIRSDIQPVVDSLQKGDFVGDQIKGTESTVFKVRVKNSDIQKGKSSGYRMIYYLKTPTKIILITLYSKLEQTDITAKQIRKILKEFEQQDT